MSDFNVKSFIKQPGDSNPVMTQHFGADPYAIVYDGRVYLYMTGDAIGYDEAGNIKENIINGEIIMDLLNIEKLLVKQVQLQFHLPKK